MERHKPHGKIDTDKRHENGNERAQHTFNGRSRNNLKRTEEAERRTRNKGQARISVFGATGKPTFQNVMPEPPFARIAAYVYNTVRGKRRVINVNVCQQLVGHASADMTINVYTHVMDEFKRKEAAKFSLFPTF